METVTQSAVRRSAHPYHIYDAIQQQPDRIAQLLENTGAEIERAAEAAASRQRLVLAGIGSSYHAALIGAHFLRHLSGGRTVPLVEHSFEFVHYPFVIDSADMAIIISHGGSNDSLRAMNLFSSAGSGTIAVVGREAGDQLKSADIVIPTCEREDSFAHTKSYTTALAALAAFSVQLAQRRGWIGNDSEARAAVDRLPGRMRAALGAESKAREAAREIAKRKRWIFAGAGPNWPTACEGALKVKETSYLPADGFETEQFLHGPQAELDSRAAVTVFLTGGPTDQRAKQLLRLCGELGVLRVAVAAAGVNEIPAEYSIEVPEMAEWLSPFVQVVAAQLLSYFVALECGSNPDTGREDHAAYVRARRHIES